MQFSELSNLQPRKLGLHFVCVHNDPLKLLNMMKVEASFSRLDLVISKSSFQAANVVEAVSLTSDEDRYNNSKQLL